ncbi:MAG: RIO1 family regulatory kinase/ATPase [Marmoricola sp.]
MSLSNPAKPSATDQIDPAFVCDFRAYDDPDSDSQRWSTWLEVEPLCRGPEPRPDWVVTDRAAIDTELGVLKTGKEADVFLLERAVERGPSVVMAAKRYRSPEHSDFHRSTAYTEGRRARNSRDTRAVARRSAFGRSVAAAQWATAEWNSLKTCWSLGLPVPYPVQIDGTELLMEWIRGEDQHTAPRLAQTRPPPARLSAYFDQLVESMTTMARHGIAHGDLSAYNLLAAGERLVIIDLPQVVDVVGNPRGPDLLLRDCVNICAWFRRQGLEHRLADEHALFAELISTIC